MKMSSQAVVIGLAALFSYAATALDGAALAADSASSQPAGSSQTIGSWIVSGAGGVATAVLTPAAITFPPSGSPAANMISFRLTLNYGENGNNPFQGSTVFVTHNSLPLPPNLAFHVLADGKDVGQFYDNAIGGDLTVMFGADLAGLASVQNFTIIIKNSPVNNPPMFAANLQQTAAALAAMKTVAAAVAAAQHDSETETDGAWHLWFDQGRVQVDPTAAATVISSVKLGPSLRPCVAGVDINYDGPYQGYDFTSAIGVILFLPVEHQKDAKLLLLADGQQIDSIDVAKMPAGQSGSNAWGGVYFSKPLTAYFGQDLQGLASVNNLKIVVSMAGTNTTIYEVNLSATDQMLQNLPRLRDLSIRRMMAGVKRRRPTLGPGATEFTPPPVTGVFKFMNSPPANPSATGSK
jgi:hypothetical protein